VWAEKNSDWYHTLIRDGWTNWHDFVDQNNLAMMVKNLNADPQAEANKEKGLPND
jgi:hypothetical protein